MRFWMGYEKVGSRFEMRPMTGLGLVLMLCWATVPSVFAEQDNDVGDFAECLIELQAAARDDGVSEATIESIVGSLDYLPRVIELDRAQPEFLQTFSAYLSTRVTTERIVLGRALLAQHRELFDRLTREYGVPGHYLVALWGMESNFGRFTGSVPTLDALATLACDPRRADFFRSELLFALRLMERESLDPDNMRGSWAGAMGQTQFMPSAYFKHAVDGDGDGRIDLWKSLTDALASGANYLASLGWNTGERWGREVLLPDDFDYAASGTGQAHSLQYWAGLGVRRTNGQPLPQADMQAALLVPMGHRGPAFLVYENFNVLMRWNRSESFAIATGHLADRIAGEGPLRAELPEQERAVSLGDVKDLQQSLAALGHEPGEIDGIIGPATRAALQRFQVEHDLIADGYPDPSVMQRVVDLAGAEQGEQ